MSKILTLGALETEKLQKPRWPKYCETPCRPRFHNSGSNADTYSLVDAHLIATMLPGPGQRYKLYMRF